MRALPRLYDASLDPATFDEYGGHLLLALTLIATTSRNADLCRTAREMALERATQWRDRWPLYRSGLNGDTVMQAVIATFAIERLGLPSQAIRHELRRELDAARAADLLYFDAAVETVPGDIPYECCGLTNARGAVTCASCNAALEFHSRYDIWYYALTSAYFCERCGLDLSVSFVRILERLADLRPYPATGGAGFYHAIYAATHIVYTLNDYGSYLLSPSSLPEEVAFLRGSLDWATAQGEADTIGELLDSLSALGMPDDDQQLSAARRFLLDSQLPDGSWGNDDGDRYAYFHTLWAAIDGLREHAWKGQAVLDPVLQRTVADLQR